MNIKNGSSVDLRQRIIEDIGEFNKLDLKTEYEDIQRNNEYITKLTTKYEDTETEIIKDKIKKETGKKSGKRLLLLVVYFIFTILTYPLHIPIWLNFLVLLAVFIYKIKPTEKESELKTVIIEREGINKKYETNNMIYFATDLPLFRNIDNYEEFIKKKKELFMKFNEAEIIGMCNRGTSEQISDFVMLEYNNHQVECMTLTAKENDAGERPYIYTNFNGFLIKILTKTDVDGLVRIITRNKIQNEKYKYFIKPECQLAPMFAELEPSEFKDNIIITYNSKEDIDKLEKLIGKEGLLNFKNNRGNFAAAVAPGEIYLLFENLHIENRQQSLINAYKNITMFLEEFFKAFPII